MATITKKGEEALWEAMFKAMTSTDLAHVQSTAPLTIEMLEEAIEKCRPSHAILLSNMVCEDSILEIDNMNREKFYCEKLLVINTAAYDRRLHQLFRGKGINLRVYDPSGKHDENGNVSPYQKEVSL